MNIRFGTSGWRAIIADEFTYENVRLVTNAICGYLKKSSETAGRSLIIAHDTRFMGEEFSAVAAKVAAESGMIVRIFPDPTPTPAISFWIRSMNALGALNFTASHNPPEYQGIKFSTSNGAPALPEVTAELEQMIESRKGAGYSEGGSIEEFDPKQGYLDDLGSKIDFESIANSGASFAFDPLWGTGRGYLDKVLRDHGLKVETLHDWRDVTFGGRSPEPGADHLDELKETVVSGKFRLGLATDGDADRFGVIDSDGTFIEPNKLIALLTDYLAESREWKLGVARSVATSHLIDRVAADRGLKLHETPVGFKYIGELIDRDEIILGGEESAGLSIRGHFPEKDGILACLLAAEAVTVRNASLGEQLEALYERVGRLESGRIGVRLTDEVARSLNEKLAEEPGSIDGRKIKEVNRLDGVKFIFENDSWMLMRPSGTEPVVRIYAEAETSDQVNAILEAGRSYLLD